MNRIAKILGAMRKTQVWLATKTGINVCYLNKIVKGKVEPRVSTALRISKALDSTVDQIWDYR